MKRRILSLGALAVGIFFAVVPVHAQEKPEVPPGSVLVMRMAICRGIKNYLPDQEITSAQAGETVVGFTQMRSGLGPIKIEHRWYCNDQLMGASVLNLRTSPFKTWSKRTLTRPGHWKLQVLDPAGNVLKELSFEVTR